MERLNPELAPFQTQEKLTGPQVEHLVWLKDTVDRLATKRYTPSEVAEKLEKQFGSKPNILSWGDYFQVEVATAHHQVSDEEFLTIVQTVYHDLIAAAMIFTGKPAEFFKQVAAEARQAETIEPDSRTPEDNELIHLAILGDYFHQLGLDESLLTERDREWFRTFNKH